MTLAPLGTGSAVCRQLQRLRVRQNEEPALSGRIAKLVSALASDPELARTP